MIAATISAHPNRNRTIAISLLSSRVLGCPAGGGLQQLLQLLAPESRRAGGRVAARVFARRYQVKPTVLHAFECAFGDCGFRRVAFIVGRIDRQERGLDAFQAARGVIVARRLPLVEKVIGIAGGRRRQALVRSLSACSRVGAIFWYASVPPLVAMAKNTLAKRSECGCVA